jgi:hypothetical protein
VSPGQFGDVGFVEDPPGGQRLIALDEDAPLLVPNPRAGIRTPLPRVKLSEREARRGRPVASM